MQSADKIARYRANWQNEHNSAALYHALSECEPRPELKDVYRRLAEAEERHACFWEAKLRRAKQSVPKFKVQWRTRVLIALARRFGPELVLPNIAALEQVDSHQYDQQPEAQAGGLPQQEQSHARLLKAITGGERTGLEGSRIAQLEGRHRTGGNSLRAAVLGANDGLLSNLSLVMGVAGAEINGGSVLITGLAGLLAGALSMAIGEWLSVQSARELYTQQIDVERQELAEVPDEEAEELTLIYQAKGLPEAEAQSLARRLIQDETTALDTLAREELGIDPKELGGSARSAAITSFCLFALGAIFPVAPFFFFSGFTSVIVSLVVSAAALFTIGAGITLLTGRNVFFSGARQVLLGIVAAGVTYTLGRLIGHSLGG